MTNPNFNEDDFRNQWNEEHNEEFRAADKKGVDSIYKGFMKYCQKQVEYKELDAKGYFKNGGIRITVSNSGDWNISYGSINSKNVLDIIENLKDKLTKWVDKMQDNAHAALNRKCERDLAKAKGLEREEDSEIPETSKPEEIEVAPSKPESEDDGMDETKSLLEKIQGGMPSIPGLDPDSILSKLISGSKEIQKTLQPYQDAIENANTEEEREKAKENLKIQIDSYKSQLSGMVNEQISIIKTNYQTIVNGCKSLGEAIPAFIANMAIPKVIVVGSAAGTANPATALIEAKQFKSTCGSILNVINVAAVSVLQACIKLKFPVPEVVKTAIEGISILAGVINSIP